MTLRTFLIWIGACSLVAGAWFAMRGPTQDANPSGTNTVSALRREDPTSATSLAPHDDSARERGVVTTPESAGPSVATSRSTSAASALVRVRVVDATNRQAMSGALVSSVVEGRSPLEACHWRPDAQLVSSGGAFDTLRSNADGRAEIRALMGDELRIQVLDDRRSRILASIRTSVTEIESDVELRVPAPLRVGEDMAFFVRVLDADSHAPIVGATIEEPRYRPRSWKTNDDGLAECKGAYGLGMAYPVTVTGYGMRRVRLESGHDSAESAAVVELSKGASLAVRLFGSDGRARPRASLALTASSDRVTSPARPANILNWTEKPATWSATSDDDGWARFTEVTPHVVLELHEVDEARILERTRGWVAPESIVLEPGEQRTLEWTMSATCRLTGRALDVDGKPMPGVDVWCMRSYERAPQVLERPSSIANPVFNGRVGDVPEDTTEAKTDDDGRFTFDDVDPGFVLVGIAPVRRSRDILFFPPIQSTVASTSLEPDAPGMDTSEHPVAVANLVDISIGVTHVEADAHALVGRRIRGRLLDPAGNPCMEGSVSATCVETGLRSFVACQRDGHFEFPALPPGTYELEGSWFGRFGSSERAIVPAGSKGVDLHLRPASTVSGKVIDENGCHGRGETRLVTEGRIAKVSYSSWDDSGTIDFKEVSPGIHVIVAVTFDGRVGMSQPFEVRTGVPLEGIEVHVARGGLVGVRHTGSQREGKVTILHDGVPLHVESLQRGERRDFDVPAGPTVVRCTWPGEPTRATERTVTVRVRQTTQVDLSSDSK